MKIFFYSTVFAPSVGGIETLVELLCRAFVAMGHDVVLATKTPGDGTYPFEVRRQPSFFELTRLTLWCDVHVQASVSLKVAWLRLLALGKTLYQHNGPYHRDDGSKRIVDRLKTAIAHNTPGIANSTYTALRTGAAHVILNAYDDSTFDNAPAWEAKDRDLAFLGRLVSQKGCDILIEALGRLAECGLRPRLTVIGAGPDRQALEWQVEQAGLSAQVSFLGELKGGVLAKELGRHRVLVVPSRYEEPFGIVALEGLASGCLPIVSERGGLVDAIGGHGFTFANGDARALADCIARVLRDPDHARKRLEGVERHLTHCRARAVAERYVKVFVGLLEKAN